MLFIWSIALYGSETWTLQKEDIRRLEAFEIWILRRMMKVSWTEHRTNEEVLQMVEAEREIMYTLWSRQKRWIGHILRHDSLLKTTLEGQIQGKKGCGRKTKNSVLGLTTEDGGSYYWTWRTKDVDTSQIKLASMKMKTCHYWQNTTAARVMDGGGGINWSYETCKAQVRMSPPTNQHPVLFTGRMPFLKFLSPNQHCQSTEGKAIEMWLLHCMLSLVVQCIVIGPVCVCVCLWVCYHDNSKVRISIFTKLGL